MTTINDRGIRGARGADPRLGRLLADRYRLTGLLGEGAIGVVYRGITEPDAVEVAIKFMHAPWAKVAEYCERFAREARVLSTLKHPCLVEVLDFGRDQDNSYLVMELLAGETLRVVMQRETLSFERVVKIIADILSVLEVAHAQGVVHRDLKPDNVMLMQDGHDVDNVKVFDFGLAFVDDQPEGQRLTEPNSVRGTPLYMAPEQCRGRPVTAASDVYSVGVMLYELLVGRVPFGDEGSTDVMAQHVFVPPPAMEQWATRAVPAALEALTMDALQKRPELRPTAAALRASLLQTLTSR
jgi:serine/threonine-protein kinase